MENINPNQTVVINEIWAEDGSVMVDKEKFSLDIDKDEYFSYLTRSDLPHINIWNRKFEHWYYSGKTGAFHIRENTGLLYNGIAIPLNGTPVRVSSTSNDWAWLDKDGKIQVKKKKKPSDKELAA